MSVSGVVHRVILLSLLILVSDVVKSQTFLVQPAEIEDAEGEFNARLLLPRDDVFRLNWSQLDGNALDLSGAGAKLIIGRSANTYDLTSENVSGLRAEFIPDNIGLTPGRYYARITNSNETTTSNIRSDFENDPTIIFSNEIQLIIEAKEAPSIIAPRGNIEDPAPTFQWTAIAGVPSYFLIVSSTPFDIIEDENGEVAIEGATIVWQYITNSTTAVYGDVNDQSPFQDNAPPLNSGQEYSYTVLNVYEENNPTFTSTVFGGIIPFTYTDPNAIPSTNLTNPANEETFFAEEIITFEWEEISSASNYTINLYQVVKQQGIDVTIPIWSSTTTNTLIEYPALENLKNGRYQWNVITNNSTGGGSTSSNRFFNYVIETGEFGASIVSSLDNSTILGAELNVRAISGGVTPVIPFFVQSETHYDSLVVGTYEFKASKEGFENAVGEYTINDDRQTTFTMEMSPLPSSIIGNVNDENGEAVDEAVVVIEGISSEFNEQTSSDVNGEFNFSVNEGTYTISVSKTGYINAEDQSVTIGLNEEIELSDIFELVNDEASISGTVFNDQGEPIQRATVTIEDGTNTYDANTNGAGLYQFTVSSGTWTLSVEKIGFVKPNDQTISISTGDVIQNQNFTLIGNANQITGFVRERITNEDGSTGTTIFADVEVKAIPTVGEAISTRSSQNGQYTLSLRSGSYEIEAIEDNYTSSETREIVIGIAVGETISGVDFELIPNPSSISGTVTLPSGNGVVDALVTVENVGSTTTSSSGFYELSVPEGTQTVSVTKNGLVSPEAKNVTVSVGQDLAGVDFVMTPNAGTVSGAISSGGEPLSNTRVIAVNTENGNTSELTNELDGTYSINLSSGNWYIKAQKSGFISDSTSVLAVGPGQQLVNQNLSLIENLTTVRGTITDGTDALRNANVEVTSLSDSDFEQSTFTQVNGTYAFTLPAGSEYSIRASKNGYQSKSSSTSQLVAGETISVDLELNANPSSIAGTITTNNNSALRGAVIVAKNSSGVRVDSATSNSDGEYLLGLEPDTYLITAKKPGYTSSNTNTTLSIGENITEIDHQLDENFAFINGTITDTDDNPIEQAFVNLTKTGGVGASTVTDQEGNFSISRLTTGEFSIEFSKTGYISYTENFNLNDGDFKSIEESLSAKNGSISGVVQDENGVLIVDATVSALNTEGINYTAITEANGQYTITSVEPSNYSVNASKAGFTTSDPTIVEVSLEDLNVTDVNVTNLIPNNGVISGTITNQFSGDAIKDAEISAIGARGSGVALSGSDGSFEISNLIPSEYTLITSKVGFKSDTVSITIQASNPTETVSRQLLQNNGTILGQVLDEEGNTLPFRATVIATSNSSTLTTQSDEEGNFAFEGVETGVSYTIETDIYREGYDNTTTSIAVALGADEVTLPAPLSVGVQQGIIKGNVGIGSATVKLLNASNRQIVELATSNSAGNYQFDFLSSNDYLVTVNRLGYVFTPDTSSVLTLSATEEVTQDFNGVSNIGTLTVITNIDNQPRSNVSVSIVSADTTVIQSKKTSAQGLATFSDIKAGTDYTVRVSLKGYTSNPEVQIVGLSTGDSTSTTFNLSANSSTITGLVQQRTGSNTSNLRNANIAAVSNQTGQRFESTTNRDGLYTIDNLASGNYQLIGSLSGFVPDTVSLVLAVDTVQTADTLFLEKASVSITGFVFFKGDGVEGVDVQALSSNSFAQQTNESGRFRFSSLPIKTGANDTTTYQIKVQSGVFSKSYQLSLTADDIGTNKNLPNTNLPSGQINLTVTDGVEPLEGATLEFGISGGEADRTVTGSTGSFSSDDNLRKATYVVSVAKEGLLTPQNTIRIALPTDTTILSEEIVIPYRQLAVSEILADASTEILVVNASGYDNSAATGTLYYKRASQSQFTTVEMAISGDTLSATIPALNSVENLTFFTTIEDTIANNSFISRERTIKPLASGILTNILVSPNLNGQSLRVGETYNLEVLVRDGVNKSLADEFSGAGAIGNISWVNQSDTTGILLSNQVDTEIQVEAVKVGTYSLKVSANLEGSLVSTTLNVTVKDIPLESIIVSSPGKQLSNSSSHLFSYSAIDTSGNAVLLGSSLEWDLEPSSFGSIDIRGVFTPSSTNLLGLFSVTVRDTVSGLSGIAENIEMVARISPDESYVLNNGDGLTLELPTGSVAIPSQISLSETQPAPSKKFVFAQGTDQSYTVGDRIYLISLAGSELITNATLTLPEDSTFFRLDTGDREIGRFNILTLQWELFENLATKSFSSQTGTISTDQLGQFAVLSANQPLGIRNAAVLPSPFSPDIAPVRIGYWLDTAFPPAKVTVKIFNMRGELVRTLFEDALQQAGRYGSRSSDLEITWDGRTDGGLMARNGRYIIQITAKDQLAEEVKLLQVILIK